MSIKSIQIRKAYNTEKNTLIVAEILCIFFFTDTMNLSYIFAETTYYKQVIYNKTARPHRAIALLSAPSAPRQRP